MNIAITGSTGLIGTAVAQFLERHGHAVTSICRPSPDRSENEHVKFWNATSGRAAVDILTGHDCIIHLAGENIAAKRWTAEYKSAIFDSRVKGTKVISQSLAEMRNSPKLFICASAVGIYGSHPSSEVLDEASARGTDFLADVCYQWEQATLPASQAGIRVCLMRFGVVLSGRGGALSKMLMPFKMGLGGRMGLGRQTMSWIALDEIPLIIKHVMDHENINGAINCVSPESVSNADFSKLLGRTLRRPLLGPMPSPIVKLLFGEMGEALLLGGQNVAPKKLLDSGYQFTYHSLQDALESSLKEA